MAALREVIMTNVGVINGEKLDTDIRAACPHYAGFSTRPRVDGIILLFDPVVDDLEVATAQDIVRNHDAQQLTPQQQTLQNIKSVAQTAVGVDLTLLTAGQQRALLAVLLWKAGGVASDGTVNPLGQWAR